MKRKYYKNITIGFILFFTFLLIIFLLMNKKIVISQEDKIKNNDLSINLSSWLWRSPDSMSDDEIDQILSFAEKENITTLYVETGKYFDLFESNDSTAIKDFETRMQYFIGEAQKRGIKIEALAGDVTWANPDYSYIPLSFTDLIFAFNANYPDTSFSGIHFDIEYYNQDNFDPNQEKYANEYLDLVQSLQNKVSNYNSNGKNITLAFDLASWLDEGTKKVTYNGVSNFPIYHMLTLLNSNPNAYLVLMSYQDNPDNAIKNSENEFAFTKNNGISTPIVIAQETSQTEEKNISYWGKPKNEFILSLTKIDTAFKNYSNYRGIAIHHIDSYREMK